MPLVRRSTDSIIAWQGWRLGVPSRWSPVKLDGGYDSGYLLLADLTRPRLGVKWARQLRRRFEPSKWAARIMREEVGRLAADEAVSHDVEGFEGGLLYSEPEPPGRDVWLGYSPRSRRTLLLSYFSRRRERALPSSILPGLEDLDPEGPMPWSIYELSCVAPAGMRLESHSLNAGDLALGFTGRRQRLIVRQIAVAGLALARLPLEKWLVGQARLAGKHYKKAGDVEPAQLEAAGQTLEGLKQRLVRRRRFFYRFLIAKQIACCAWHDRRRDRLILTLSSDEEMGDEVARTVGWAWSAQGPEK